MGYIYFINPKPCTVEPGYVPCKSQNYDDQNKQKPIRHQKINMCFKFR